MDPSVPGGGAADAIVAARDYAIADAELLVRDRDAVADNGTLSHITDIDCVIGAVSVITDSGDHLLLDATYAADHLHPAYAVTGHGAHGATVEWVGVIGRPSEFTREWAYTSLSRARGNTLVRRCRSPGRASRARGVRATRTRARQPNDRDRDPSDAAARG
jgi:hypothetical protein